MSIFSPFIGSPAVYSTVSNCRKIGAGRLEKFFPPNDWRNQARSCIHSVRALFNLQPQNYPGDFTQSYGLVCDFADDSTQTLCLVEIKK